MGDMIIGTRYREFANELESLKIEGVRLNMRHTVTDSGDYKDVANAVFNFTAEFATDIAKRFFAQWLYDRIKKRPEQEAMIQAQPIPSINITAEKIIIMLGQEYEIRGENTGKPKALDK